MVRSFLAIELPQVMQETVADTIRELSQSPSKIKWVSPQQTHLTLKFFGSIPSEVVEKIADALSPVIAHYPRFHLTLKGLGAFPNLFRPRVIWIGFGGEMDTLRGLQRAIERTLVALGIPEEERSFQGHLTLGRNKDNQVNEGLYRRLSQWTKEETGLFDVKELILFRSDLKPAGPHYSKLRTFPLFQRENNISSTIQ
jgi:RNA 2',3'-cyclic 3'-phosphodiesterase